MGRYFAACRVDLQQLVALAGQHPDGIQADREALRPVGGRPAGPHLRRTVPLIDPDQHRVLPVGAPERTETGRQQARVEASAADLHPMSPVQGMARVPLRGWTARAGAAPSCPGWWPSGNAGCAARSVPPAGPAGHRPDDPRARRSGAALTSYGDAPGGRGAGPHGGPPVTRGVPPSGQARPSGSAGLPGPASRPVPAGCGRPDWPGCRTGSGTGRCPAPGPAPGPAQAQHQARGPGRLPVGTPGHGPRDGPGRMPPVRRPRSSRPPFHRLWPTGLTAGLVGRRRDPGRLSDDY